MTGPPSPVLRAFGAGAATPVRLPGGRGRTWRAGSIVLRPHDEPVESDWRSGVLADLRHTPDFRAPRPVAASDGTWRSGGWEALEWLDARADETRVADVIRAGDAFHRAVAHLDRPAFLDRSDDAWSRADRMVWAEARLPREPSLDRLAAAFRPVVSPSQLVHGDLLGNVLFAPARPPVVIDWPPYWRPVGLGAAVAAVDAACWHGVSVSRLLPLGDGVAEWEQLLVRALAFRITTLVLLDVWDVDGADRHRPVIDALV
ncbi:hypothetical protein DEJ17_07240 [Curtobacterium sp. MCSS17_011]|uniref:hypothetical protein n=1 Tax=Curtobacterium sp. MCSS17_011 TaxID=2175643 RepID=UPI000DA06E7C|nr:hypothetical protein [Curtobacterium sp. MCSS17_011]PYY59529.1 hypothetical protein DEJ17_07240 [Curtobacterium sp. MCSS17_011]